MHILVRMYVVVTVFQILYGGKARVYLFFQFRKLNLLVLSMLMVEFIHSFQFQ